MGCFRRQRLCLGGAGRTLPFVRRFTPAELEAATNGFTTVVDAGPGRAAAYGARFAGGLAATVVRRRGAASGEEKAAFYLEVQLLGRLNHRHLVRLRGFSEGRAGRFLVFDRAESNRSLKDCLHDPLRTPLDWRTRLQVAMDVAAALEYLYYFCDPPVFHASVSSSTVVMDADFVAKLSDVSVIGGDHANAMTAAATDADSFQGLHHSHGCLNNAEVPMPSPDRHCLTSMLCWLVVAEEVERRRADAVFRYGVLVLELVTGQSAGGDGELVRWAQGPGVAASMHRMVDADLGGAYDARELRDLVVAARLCTRPPGEDGDDAAVSIPQILRYLQGKLATLDAQTKS